jgi:hypothetical protein
MQLLWLFSIFPKVGRPFQAIWQGYSRRCMIHRKIKLLFLLRVPNLTLILPAIAYHTVTLFMIMLVLSLGSLMTAIAICTDAEDMSCLEYVFLA